MRGVASAIIGTGSKFMPLPSAHAHGTNGQCRILFVHIHCIDNVSMVYEHVLLIDDYAYYSHIVP